MSYQYLSSPYSSGSLLDPEIMKDRYSAALHATAWLLKHRQWVYSPIVHNHVLAWGNLPTDADYWKEYNFAMLSKASRLLVLAIPGWKESKGVGGEIRMAFDIQLEVRLLEPRFDLFPPGYQFGRRIETDVNQ